MKEKVSDEERNRFEGLTCKFSLLFIATIVLPVPMVSMMGYIGFGIWAVLAGITFYVAIILEKEKRKFDVQTFKEIIAFREGKSLDEIEKAREEGKRPYQKVLLAVASGIITGVIAIILGCFFR